MPQPLAPQTGELSPEDFAAGLKESQAAPEQLSPEDFAGGLKGLMPEKPGFFSSLAGGALEGLASIPDMLAKGVDYLGGTEPAIPGGMRPLPYSSDYGQGPQLGEEAFGPAAAALRGGAQAVYPEETRGRGGLKETLGAGAGQALAGAAGLAVSPAAGAVAFGAQMGMPVYYDVLAKTGDKQKAMAGLLFGAGVGELTGLGIGKAASGILTKLATGKLGAAAEKAVLAQALGRTLKGATIMSAQNALVNAAREELTGEDIDQWQSFKAQLPEALLLSGGFHAVDAALSGLGRSVERQTTEELTGPPVSEISEKAPAQAPVGLPEGVEPPAAPVASEPTEAPAAVAGAEVSRESLGQPREPGVTHSPGTASAERQPSTAPSAAAGTQPTRRETLTQRKPYELTAKEAEEAYQLQSEHEKTADVQALGEAGAKEWNALHRKANSTLDMAGADRAQARIDEIESKLTDEQKRLLFGIGETGMSGETLRDLSRALSDVRSADSERELGRIVALSLVDVGTGDPDTFRPESKEAFAAAKLKEAERIIREKGWDTAKVTKSALERATEVYGDDAPEMLERWFPKERPEPKQPAPKQIAAAAGTPSRPGAAPKTYAHTEEPEHFSMPAKSELGPVELVPVGELRSTQKERMRNAIDDDRVFALMQAMAEGEKLPPIVAIEAPTGERIVIDGDHRLEAAKSLDFTHVPVRVVRAAKEGSEVAMRQHPPAEERIRAMTLEEGSLHIPLTHEGRRAGTFVGTVNKRALREVQVNLRSDARGKGIASRAYQALADKALESGRIFESDNAVSTDDARVWESLGRKGYTLEKNPDAKLHRRAPGSDVADAWIADRPVYRVTAGPKVEAPPGQAPAAEPLPAPTEAPRGEQSVAPEGGPKGIVEMFAGPPSPFGKGPNITTSKVKKTIRKFLFSEGHTPREARRELEIASGAQHAEVMELARRAKLLDRAMAKEHGRAWRTLPEAENVDRAFEGDQAAMAKLNPEAQLAVSAMRAHLDRLIRLQVKKGGVIDPSLRPEFAQKILASAGRYANRFYKAHLDPKWAEKVPADVRQRLFTLWQSWAQPLSKAELQDLKLRAKTDRAAKAELISRRSMKGLSDEEISGQMDAILQEAKEGAESPWKALSSGKLGRKNLSIYKARKIMPEEFKAFLGEVKDPISNYANSVVKISGVLAKHEAFTNIRKSGLGKWLHEKPTGEFTARLSAEGTPSLKPLDGLYTTPEIKEALASVGPKEQAAWVKGVVAANAFIKWGKVLGQPWSVARNLLSNVTLTVANGHLPGFYRSSEWKAAFSKLEDLEEQKRLIRLGVIGASTSTVEWQDLRSALAKSPEEIVGGKGGFLAAKGAVEKVYESADNAPKIRFFYAEEKALVKAGYSEKRAEEIASDRVRDLMPTTERMNAFFKAFRKQPVLGSYFAFKAEVMRTFGNRMRLIAQELKSANPEVRAMGRRRALGSLIAATVTPAMVYAFNSLNGIDADEDEDRRAFVPPWDKNSRLVWFGGEREGSYFDPSDVDPFTMFSDPISRVLGGADANKAMQGWFQDEAKNFFGPSPIAKLAVEMYTGKTEDGKPIDDMAEHVKTAVQPGFVTAYERAEEKGVGPEVAATATGFRQYDFEVEKSLFFDVQAFRRSLEESTSKRWRQQYKSPSEESFKTEQETTRKEAFQDLSEKVAAAGRLGVSRRTIEKMLEDALSDDVARAILTGSYIPYREPKSRKKAFQLQH